MFPCQGGRKRLLYWLTLISGFVESLFFTGIVIGWASVVFALKADGYFSGYCVNATNEENQTVYLDCSSQDQHLTQVMSVSSIINTLTRFPIGYIFDRYGTIVTRLIAMSLYTMGTLLVSLSNTDMSEVLYPAFSCILISGGILYFTNVQVGNLFETHRSTIITVYNGAYDSSAFVFLIIKLLYERGVSLQSSFLFLSLCGVLHLLRTLFLMPTGHIPYLLPENYTYGLGCPGQRTCKRKEEDGKQEAAASEPQAEVRMNLSSSKAEAKTSALDATIEPVPEKIQEEVVSFKSCVISWLFFWHLLWLAIIRTCHLVLITNLNPTLSRLANNDQNLVSYYTNIFAIIQLCGVVFSPLNGCIMDRHKHKPLAPGQSMREADLRSSFLALLLTSLQCFILCACFTCPILPLQYVTFVLQVVNSSFLYGGHQSFIALAFPTDYFGKLSGTAMMAASLGMLLQLPLPSLIQHQFQGDPFYVYMGITLVSLLSFIHPIHVNLYCRRMAKQRMQ